VVGFFFFFFPSFFSLFVIAHRCQHFKTEAEISFKHPGVLEETESHAGAVVSVGICLASDRGNNITGNNIRFLMFLRCEYTHEERNEKSSPVAESRM